MTLLATDLDGTLVGDDSALAVLKDQLAKLRNSGQLKLVYVTGRSLEMYQELRDEKGLLEPDALLAAVGSEIYLDGVRQADWPQVEQWSPRRIHEVLAGYSGLTPQPPTEQRDFKLCFYFDNAVASVTKIQAELGSDYAVIYSSNRYLDILPAGVNKATALEQLCRYWQLPLSIVIAAGDSGNDISMLGRYKAIIVGNASAELRQWQLTATNPALYVAKASYARGITEGLRHFGLLGR